MVEKRSFDNSATTAVEPAADGSNGTAEAIKKPKLAGGPPSLSLAALERAKKALQLQKELKEKLKTLNQVARPETTTAAAVASNDSSALAAKPQSAIAAATAKAAQVAARFGVSVTPAPAAAAGVLASASAAPAALASSGFKPAPLLLDANGRPVDAQGHLLSKPAMPQPTLRVNQSVGLQPKVSQPGTASILPVEPVEPTELEGDAFFDPRVGASGLKRLNRKARTTFDFVQEGTFQRQAEEFRLKARYGGMSSRPRGPIGPALASGDLKQIPSGSNANLIPIGGVATSTSAQQQDVEDLELLPVVEWWDRNLLASGSYEQDVPQDPTAPVAMKEGKITAYVEHPVPIQPPAEAVPPPPQPLKLTARELKKLRTQRRQAREKEKQDLIRQGLLEPSKPKVKLSNLYRVLGEQAIADPTRLEMETKKQMQERQGAHDDRNLARMLTESERREKKLKKMFDGTELEIITSVYRISRLDNKQHRYKVDINAKENHMTGMLFITPEFSLVVVEGCNKASKRYAKLMLRRIDWTEPPSDRTALDDDEDAAKGADDDASKEPNRCDLVWQGLVKQAAFQGFKVENCKSDHAQQILTQRNVLHYWHAAHNFVPGESIPISLY